MHGKCLFVSLFGVYRPTREFFTNMVTSPLPMKGCKFNFGLCSALMAIEQWGFLNLPQLLWHGPTLYNVTLTPVVERLAVKLSLPVLRLRSVVTGYRTPISRMRDEHSTSSPSRRLMTKFIIIRLKVELIYSFHCGRMQEGY